MSLAVSAQGTKLYMGTESGPGSPTNFVQIKEVKTFSRDGERPEIDVSSLDSTSREYRLGLKNNGNLSFEMNKVADDTGQLRLIAALSETEPSEFKLEYSNGDYDLFQGLVKSANPSGGVDEVVTVNAVVRITGDINAVNV